VIVRGIEKLLELGVSYRILVDVEGLDLDGMFMKTTSALFPRVRDVYADIVGPSISIPRTRNK
jgi:hypothetical protein